MNKVIHTSYYPSTTEQKIACLDKLIEMDVDLTCDIEGFSLKHYNAGIGTISFAWDKHNGIAFEVDDCLTMAKNHEVRQALKQFFIKFNKRLIYHKAAFDVTVLIYQLFMRDILDQEGLLEGLKVMLKNWECTLIMSFLATNNCQLNLLGLKEQSMDFTGNYALKEITDIRQIPLPELLEYNLTDTLATWYVAHKHWPTVKADNQLETYEYYKRWSIEVIQMQLTGLPVNRPKAVRLEKKLNNEVKECLSKINQNSIIQEFVYEMEEEALDKKNEEILAKVADYERQGKSTARLKTTPVTRDSLGKTKALTVWFNPNSPVQLQRLLFDTAWLGLPVLAKTKTQQPSTKGEILEKLVNHTKNQNVKDLLELVMEFKAIAKILNTFLPAVLNAKRGPDGWWYLFGNFNIGGALSGRMSSSDPNLQNIPSTAHGPVKSRLAKMIKECFEAPKGWIFVGMDSDQLEDRIGALTSKDPAKLKVYLGINIYTLEINGCVHHVRGDSTIVHQGQTYTGDQYYEKVRSKGL